MSIKINWYKLFTSKLLELMSYFPITLHFIETLLEVS